MSSCYSITIAGTGYVGLVAGVCFAEKGHNVICVDTNQEKIELLNKGVSPIFEEGLEELLEKNLRRGTISFTTDYANAYKSADSIFIGVGTPEKENGSADLSYLAMVSKQIAESIVKDCLIVVKSTVPVGTNDKVEKLINDFLGEDVWFDVVSNPEFLAQGQAVHDTLCASRIIVGVETDRAKKMMEEIYEPFKLPIVFMSRRSAELTKYACNDFLALKISYINDIANLCECVDADIEEIAEGMSYDPRIGSKFLKAGIGYGGSCFPKDTKALNYTAAEYGYNLKTVEAAVAVNEFQKMRLYNKVKKDLITVRNLEVAVLGLAFKPGTDDLREAPSVPNVSELLNDGAIIRVYDPVAMDNFKTLFPDNQLIYCDSPKEALEAAHLCMIFTEWDSIKSISPNEFLMLMKIPRIYDGRNIFNPAEMKNAGIEYCSIGRKKYFE